MRTILVISSAALALAACQKSPAASGSATETATAGAPATPLAGGTPRRRAGLWQQTIGAEGSATTMGTMKICVDAASETKAAVFGHNMAAHAPGGAHCNTSAPIRGLDGSYTFASTCTLPGGGSTINKGVLTGDLSSEYRIHVDTTTTGASIASLNGHHVVDMAGKWVGPCPAGMAGGDVELGNGMSIKGGKIAAAAAMLRGATGRGTPAGQ